jgi:alpha-2-macroglobulin
MNRLRDLLRRVFGEVRWTPPVWPARVAAPALSAYRRSPRATLGALAAVVVLLGAGYGAWLWWKSRPQPAYLAVAIQQPAPTPLPTDANPTPSPYPLIVRYSGAAAPLESVGKEVSDGIRVDPAVAGTWRWSNDRELVFTPAADWEVGREYQVSFERRFFARQALLERYQLTFGSPRFAARLEAPAFYEDPTDPRNKRVTATLRFTHPVDRASLEKRIALRLRVDPAKDFRDASVQSFGFKVAYDEVGGTAYVTSDVVTLPEREGEMRVEVDDGVAATRGGPGTDVELAQSVRVPSVATYFRLDSVAASVVSNEAHEMERVVTLQFTAPVRSQDLSSKVAVYELPKDKPAIGDAAASPDHDWSSAGEVVPQVLAKAVKLEPTWLPAATEYAKLQAFRYQATAGRWLYVRVERGAHSFGDYALAETAGATALVEEMPRTVEILHEGSLLSLTGEKKLSVLVRNLRAVQLELSRVLPGALALLSSQNYAEFQKPSFRGYMGGDDLSEIFREVHAIPDAPPGTPQYDVVDFASFLSSGAAPRGLFLLNVRGWNAETKQVVDGTGDQRLVLLTDLGLLVKDAQDGSHDVFVMSLRTGEPVADASVAILGRNGLPALSASTDASGRASLPSFKDLEREKAPTVYVVRKGNDLSFLPYERYDRRLDLSRYDVGGLQDQEEAGSLQAFAFSDRGIYRPGEEVRLGLVVKPLDWRPLPADLPLEIALSDPRGVEIRREVLSFPAAGFRDWRFATLETSLTGTYTAQLWTLRDGERSGLLGETSVSVEEFQPDRLKIDVQLSAPPSAGWIAPKDLSARVSLRNLFGTLAVGNPVKGSLRLSPSYPAFAGWEGWNFFDPLSAKQSYDETLAELATDEKGEAVFPLALERFERATYRLRFLAQGFEADGGRSVAMDVSAIVSPLPWLLAWKPDGDLGFVRLGSTRAVTLRAVGPDLAARAVEGLSAELVEVKYVSVLQRQPNGLLAYQSVRKEESRGKTPLAVAAAGTPLALPATAPGSFVYVLRDAEGTELNRVAFEVVGEGNVAAKLDRNAELSLSLSKSDYAPGEEIEIEVRAPYTGAGLITIERDRVYASRWFRADTTSSVQRIRLPEKVEGNAYVVVSFLRGIDSSEVYLSPLSSGAAPFSVSRSRHVQPVALDVPDRIEPGATLRIGYRVERATRLAVLAVDEGVLQVARWRTPDPLGHFFRKRALVVTTAQILDLLLPELSVLRASKAPGGDIDEIAAGNLNPFKRRGLPPVAYWSGVIDAPAGAGELSYTVPDHFQGALRVVGVAVDEATIGVDEKRLVVRGPFVLQPTAPYFAAPGDEIEVSTLVANVLEGSGKGARIEVGVDLPRGLEASRGPASQTLAIDEGRDEVARFRVKVSGEPGPVTLVFRASSGGKSVRSSVEMSVRPASPERTTLGTAVLASGGAAELPVTRTLFAAGREVGASASPAPLGLALGLAEWLADYPHGCTEQVVSAALPGVVLGARPELGFEPERARRLFERALATLEGRQESDGSFALWYAGGGGHDFITAWAAHFLLEAGERGQGAGETTLRDALGYLDALAQRPADALADVRAKSYAVYLLTRRGAVKTKEARALAASLERADPEAGPRDIAALLLASSFKLLNLEDEAQRLARRASLDVEVTPDLASYHDGLVHRALTLYLLSRHFPERAKKLSARDLAPIVGDIVAGRYQTLSSALTVLALDAHASLAPEAAAAGLSLEGLLEPSGSRPLAAQAGGILLRAEVPADVKRVRARGPSGKPLYAQLREKGFDRTPPTDALAQGVEVLRELRSAKGDVVTSVALGESVDVVLRVRSTDGRAQQVALLDLLPGGFEVDLAGQPLAERRSAAFSGYDWTPDYVDVREDRVVLYGWIDGEVKQFVYRLKPMNRGRYTVPPLQAEGLYDRSVEGRAPGGSLEVRE